MAESGGDFRMLRNMLLHEGRHKDKEFKIFHLLAKFLYNKRIDSSGQIRPMSPEEMALHPPCYFSVQETLTSSP